MAAKSIRLLWLAGYALLAFLTLAGCGTTDSGVIENEQTPAQIQRDAQALPAQSRTYPVPPEYLPPPGKCRIWFPGRPPEYQPPPGECAVLEGQFPLNTWLLRGAKE